MERHDKGGETNCKKIKGKDNILNGGRKENEK